MNNQLTKECLVRARTTLSKASLLSTSICNKNSDRWLTTSITPKALTKSIEKVFHEYTNVSKKEALKKRENKPNSRSGNNVYKQTLVKNIQAHIKDKQLILIAHHNSVKALEWIQMVADFKKVDTKVLAIPTNIARVALSQIDSEKFQHIYPLLVSQSILIVCSTNRLNEIMKVCKNHKKLLLLGGMLDDATLNLSTMDFVKSLPPKEQLLANLVYTIGAPLQQLTQGLSQNQSMLVHALSSLENQMKEGQNGEKDL